MKKLLLIFLLSTIYYLRSSISVLAEETTPQPSKRPVLEAREEFKAKLISIRDEKKKAIVERVGQRITELNSSRTAIMLRHLTKIEETLAKIESRDVSTVQPAIATARAAIATARATVNAQAAKTYSINITTEAKLGQSVSTTRLALAKDLQTSHQAVVAARKSVRDVLTALAKVAGEKLEISTEK